MTNTDITPGGLSREDAYRLRRKIQTGLIAIIEERWWHAKTELSAIDAELTRYLGEEVVAALPATLRDSYLARNMSYFHDTLRPAQGDVIGDPKLALVSVREALEHLPSLERQAEEYEKRALDNAKERAEKLRQQRAEAAANPQTAEAVPPVPFEMDWPQHVSYYGMYVERIRERVQKAINGDSPEKHFAEAVNLAKAFEEAVREERADPKSMVPGRITAKIVKVQTAIQETDRAAAPPATPKRQSRPRTNAPKKTPTPAPANASPTPTPVKVENIPFPTGDHFNPYDFPELRSR